MADLNTLIGGLELKACPISRWSRSSAGRTARSIPAAADRFRCSTAAVRQRTWGHRAVIAGRPSTGKRDKVP
jgi:hypothetical protein